MQQHPQQPPLEDVVAHVHAGPAGDASTHMALVAKLRELGATVATRLTPAVTHVVLVGGGGGASGGGAAEDQENG